ncbi:MULTISPECIES: hypothetical protein [Streptococcus]|nr:MULTISPECIES: hypothetical protein [Streptococcus]
MVAISACSGSDEIIGTWQAQAADGTELIIEIDKKTDCGSLKQVE